MFKIDVHTHILPRDIPKFKSRFGYGGFIELDHINCDCARMMRDDGTFFRQIESNCWDPDTRLKECDEHTVHVQVLSTVPVMFHYWAKPEDALYTSRFLNDHIADIVTRYPKRFVGLGTVPLQEPKLAVKELERCMKELGMAGIQIGTHANGWNLDDARIFEVFAAAEELGAAVFVHPWDMLGQNRMSKYWLPWLVGMPTETSLAICSMIFGGVFERLPNLRVAFAHGGGSFPATIGRIEHGFLVRPDLVAINNNVNPREYLGRFWVDSLVHDTKMLGYNLSLLGHDKVMLGTDYPFPLGELEPGRLILDLPDVEPAVKEDLLARNALRWLNLKAEQFK